MRSLFEFMGSDSISNSADNLGFLGKFEADPHSPTPIESVDICMF